MIFLNNNNRIDKAAKRFKEITKPDSYHYQQKFKYLPNWLDSTSYYYQKEANKRLPQKYYYYKRGTIIRVNFGTNLGSEFSNIHFAIVLDKKDSPNKKTLTVLPLTSKQKSDRFSLGGEIFNQTIILLIQQMQQVKKKLDKLRDEDSPDFKEIGKDISDLHRVVDLYSRYNKNSFVRLSDITTISKLRIERLNRFDPSGKIRLSNQQMALISYELLKLYLSE